MEGELVSQIHLWKLSEWFWYVSKVQYRNTTLEKGKAIEYKKNYATLLLVIYIALLLKSLGIWLSLYSNNKK